MKKPLTHRIITVAALVVAIVGTLFLLEQYYLGHYDNHSMRIQGFYKEEKDSLNVVMLGASEIYYGFDPAQAYEEYGFTSYDFALPSNPISLWKYEVEEILATQHPDVIVMEVTSASYNMHLVYKESANRYLTENMLNADNKLEIAATLGEDDLLTYYLPIIKYHSNWADLKNNLYGGLNRLTLQVHGTHLTKGHIASDVMMTVTDTIDMTGVTKAKKLSSYAEVELREFLNYLKSLDTDTEFLFVLFPHLWIKENASRYYRANTTKSLLEAEGFNYIDFNQKIEEMGLDQSTDFRDREHLNWSGSDKLTTYLGQYLAENYDLGSRDLSKKSLEGWETVVEADHLMKEYFADDSTTLHTDKNGRKKGLSGTFMSYRTLREYQEEILQR